jgi:antitoxin (DNA-binding transcriptional repressor) of toxin-antitoxin stability system
MDRIALSRFTSMCTEIVEQVARTGRPVSITLEGRTIAQIVAPRPQDADEAELGSVAQTLDLDEDVIDAEELGESEATLGQWQALNSAIARDVGDSGLGPNPVAKRRPSSKMASKTAPKKTGKTRRPAKT